MLYCPLASSSPDIVELNEIVDHIVRDDRRAAEEDRCIVRKHCKPFGSSSMGMGLSIASTIIEAHRGLIQAKNRDHGGASFATRPFQGLSCFVPSKCDEAHQCPLSTNVLIGSTSAWIRNNMACTRPTASIACNTNRLKAPVSFDAITS
jgi:hypothetical protein